MDRRRFLSLGALLALPLPDLTRFIESVTVTSPELSLELWSTIRRTKSFRLAYTMEREADTLLFRATEPTLRITATYKGPILFDRAILRVFVPDLEAPDIEWRQNTGVMWLEPGESFEFRFGNPVLTVRQAEADEYLGAPGGFDEWLESHEYL